MSMEVGEMGEALAVMCVKASFVRRLRSSGGVSFAVAYRLVRMAVVGLVFDIRNLCRRRISPYAEQV